MSGDDIHLFSNSLGLFSPATRRPVFLGFRRGCVWAAFQNPRPGNRRRRQGRGRGPLAGEEEGTLRPQRVHPQAEGCRRRPRPGGYGGGTSIAACRLPGSRSGRNADEGTPTPHSLRRPAQGRPGTGDPAGCGNGGTRTPGLPVPGRWGHI